MLYDKIIGHAASIITAAQTDLIQNHSSVQELTTATAI